MNKNILINVAYCLNLLKNMNNYLTQNENKNLKNFNCKVTNAI